MANKQTQEVELKFLINKKDSEDIAGFLERLGKPTECIQIANYYFDTANKDLHQHKIGLRIRRWNDQSEQTVKMAGTQIGAMSQRPEYNVNYAGMIPKLDLFPSDIWPQTINTEALQGELREQFRIDFQRQRWLIDIGSSTIEVAIDQGAIFAEAKKINSKQVWQEPICELEAELISGSITDLLQFSEILTKEFTLEPGPLSKAQRGFMLAEKIDG
ncbi:hypothetical protein A28LD_0284 [Idiomarina sp. A28L]|uniref:CYTH domain-containing protein n=1 Tax=Idiomarina sp. A28L TaxID=1036674 RepID=UPI00021388F9|nr:CYTH domain-containing protein [Idiomarina sp. A28L]EGN76204.1 hypothetical protein A28LD_0284 [Idiomarina sp. A28L]